MDGTPSITDLASDLEATKTALNFVWVMLAAFLVMFASAAFDAE